MNFRERLAGMNNHYRFYTLETFFEKLQINGIHYAELWCGPMHFYVDANMYEDPARVQRLCEKYQVKLIGICPEQTNPKPNNIASTNRQEAILSYYKKMIDLAVLFQANHVLVTSGWAYYDEDAQFAWKRSVEQMKRLCAYAKEKHVYLAMEALQCDESVLVNSVEDLMRYRKDVGSDQLKICIDFGAMARCEDTIEDYFHAFGKDVIHIHFVDGSPCGHLAWGDGTRDLKQDLQDLKRFDYQGFLSLETATFRYFKQPWRAEETTINSFIRLGGEL